MGNFLPKSRQPYLDRHEPIEQKANLIGSLSINEFIQAFFMLKVSLRENAGH